MTQEQVYNQGTIVHHLNLQNPLILKKTAAVQIKKKKNLLLVIQKQPLLKSVLGSKFVAQPTREVVSSAEI